MRNKTIAIVALVALMMLFPSRSTMANPTQITYYTVWYSCVISPPCCTDPMGQWTLYCDGSMVGSGWEPGHNCTTTDVTYGDSCSGGGSDGGGIGCRPNGCAP